MTKFLKSGLFLKFAAGFAAGMIGVIALQPANADSRADASQVATPVSARMIDATL